jgi:hypothetical protein
MQRSEELVEALQDRAGENPGRHLTTTARDKGKVEDFWGACPPSRDQYATDSGPAEARLDE